MEDRIAIDVRIWNSGIGRYALNLISAIRKGEQAFHVTAITRAESAQMIAALADGIEVVDVPIYHFQEQVQIPLAAHKYALLHIPHFNVPIAYLKPLVVTIHDVIHLADPAFSRSARTLGFVRPMLKIAAKKASHIITVSEHSRRDLIAHLGVSEEKVSVIYNGVSPRFRRMYSVEARATVRRVLQVDSPYILYVGNFKAHKNLLTLIRAFARLRSGGSVDHVLVLVGHPGRSGRRVLDECNRLGLSQYVRVVANMPDDVLCQVYSAADVLVVPSTREGFGFPVLEAMACGTPVISSNAASLPEVGGDAVLYFDPHNVEELAAAIERVLESPTLQNDLRAKGLKQAAKFTWEECARKHVEVYRNVLGQ